MGEPRDRYHGRSETTVYSDAREKTAAELDVIRVRNVGVDANQVLWPHSSVFQYR